MKIKDLTIADLKAAYDFVLMDLRDLKEKADKEKISVENIGAYPEVLKMEDDLYHELLNRVRMLEN